MNEIIKFIGENPVVYLATIDLNGKAKVRPFQFMTQKISERDNTIYLCTSNEKDVYNQLKNNQYVEVSVANAKAEWIRVSGKAVFVSDLNLKKEIFENDAMIQNIYQSAENPVFEVFTLEEGKAIKNDFSSNPPQEYNF